MSALPTHHCAIRTLLGVIVTVALALSPAAARAEGLFGISSFNTSTSTSQAGAHPDITTAFRLNTESSLSVGEGAPVGQVKDINVEFPPGVIGDPQAVPKCTSEEISTSDCQPSSQVGTMRASFHIRHAGATPEEENPTVPIPIYNTNPTPGHLATFVASVFIVTITIQVEVRQDGTYGLTVSVDDLSTLIPFTGASITFWGVPADPSHNKERPTPGPAPEEPEMGVPAGVAPAAFITNPTDCSGAPLTSTLRVDSWQAPGQFVTQTATLPPLTGCQALQTLPTLSVAPDTTQLDTPAGYDIDLKVPQNEEPYGLATPDLRTVSITLPLGTSLSPPVADGLEGCSDAQFAVASCPDTSKIGTVSITSPLLSNELTGSIYLGAPMSQEMYRVFLIASADGVTIRLVGHIHADPETGQLTTVFAENPQQPFSDFNLSFFGGSLAALANPAGCGPATTTSQFTSYGGQTANLSSSFFVNSNGQGATCQPGTPFTPNFSAGTIFPLAGDFSPFALTVSRADGQQTLSTITAQLPPGLLAMLSRVPLCGEPQASQGACPQSSRIGSTVVGAGAGSQPLYLQGSVYLTGPYNGSTYGLVISVPAIAGPFNLGTIIIRAQILVNPINLRLTIVSDPLPQILDGIPLRVKMVSLTMSRPEFTFNPTNCSPQVVTGIIDSPTDASASVSTPFQVGGCTGLPFAPKITVSTRGTASSTSNGASFALNVTPFPHQANLRSVVVQLPDQLQSRLSALQNACLAATFAVNPSSCPPASVVGSAKVNSPILDSPLTGPIYLVSHGEVALPALVMVLQGQGVTLDVDGQISVSKKNETSSAFNALPDVPITVFSLSLPRGPHSVLGVNGSLCSKKLVMPTTMTGQNGMQIKQSTKLVVNGCSRKHTSKKHKSKSKGQKSNTAKKAKVSARA